MPRKPILILGAGFGGLAAARTIGRALGPDSEYRVIVVDREPLHLFTPLLYELATAFVEHQNIGTARLIRSGITVDCATLLARWNVDFVQAEVVGADHENRFVRLSTGVSLPYEHCIVALGSETNYFGIPGMQEHAYTLKSAWDADRLRRRIHELLHKREEGEIDCFEIAVGGAGAAGTELAAEIMMLFRQHMMRGHLDADAFRVFLVEGRDRVLSMMDARVSRVAEERLRSLGVKLYLDAVVTELEEGAAVLGPRPLKDGESLASLKTDFGPTGKLRIDTDIFVWTGGVRGAAGIATLGLPVDARGGRCEVGPNFAVPGRENVYVIGDSALLMDPSTKMPVPWLAQAAMAHGTTVARIVLARISGGKDRAYDFRAYPMIVTVGGKFSIVQWGRAVIHGTLGWFLRGAADLRYFLGILRPLDAVRVWWRGISLYTRND